MPGALEARNDCIYDASVSGEQFAASHGNLDPDTIPGLHQRTPRFCDAGLGGDREHKVIDHAAHNHRIFLKAMNSVSIVGEIDPRLRCLARWQTQSRVLRDEEALEKKPGDS
jgi:hypothetical protein